LAVKTFSTRRADHWEIACWVVFDNSGGIRLTRGEPSLGRNERAMAMTFTVPFALFKTPTLKATVAIQAPEAMVPPIDLTAAAEALKLSLGCDVDVRIQEAVEPA
jgi:hypothetical protein